MIAYLRSRMLTLTVMCMTALMVAAPAFAQGSPGETLINNVESGAKALLVAAIGLVVAVVVFHFAIKQGKRASS